MKRIFTLLSIVAISWTIFAQNIEDAYKKHVEPTPNHWPHDIIQNWNGEYQIFLDQFFWTANPSQGNNFESAAISFSIEVVSFPFIPDDFEPNQHNNSTNFTDRHLSTKIVTDGYQLEYLGIENQPYEVDYKGLGWAYGGYNIFLKLDNNNTCDEPPYFECEGDYGLISQVYSPGNGLTYGYDYQCILPHTVLKHTLYFHCGDTKESPVIDSISWIYDNTRGMMRGYPFDKTSKEEPPLNTMAFDVSFRPSFPELTYIYNRQPPDPPITSNSIWYDSGLSNSTGSIDYFPPEEVFPNYNICTSYPDPYPLYYNPNSTTSYVFRSIYHHPPDLATYESEHVHPPSYMLLNAPLLNYRAQHYAGYNTSGMILDDTINHKYYIYESFDLSIINPKQKIIYNPSEVIINCNLTFPCNYKFLTLHGKYPDKVHEVLSGDYSKTYWDAIANFDFEYDRDYPVPVNCATNAECISNYIIHGGKTITFQPPIIIMDAYFSGKSYTNKTTIHLDPNKTYGNWTYDTETVELDSNILTLPVCAEINPNIDSIGNKSTFGSNSIPSEREIHLKVLNGLTQHPKIEVDISNTNNAHLMIYNSFGTLIRQDVINSEKKIVDYSSLIPGVYHAILICNGQTVDRLSFSKL